MKQIVTVGFVIVLVGLIVWRLLTNKREINAAKTQSAQFHTPPIVEVQPVTAAWLNQTLSLLGTIEAQHEASIIAESRGRLQHFTLALGSVVRKGQPVGHIQDDVQGIVVETNQMAAADARREMERYERLLQGGAVTQETYQTFKNKYETASLNVKQQRQVVKNGTVVSPISGLVYDKKAQAGEYVAAGAVLASVIDLLALKLVVHVPEEAAYQLKPGDKARITAQVFPDISFNGVVHYISPKGDELHNYAVELYLTNNSRNQLKAGTLANAHFTVRAGAGGLFIPRRALVGGADSAQVYVVEGNRAILKKIRLGTDQDDRYQVLAGLKSGEALVVNGQLNLTDGITVRVSQRGPNQAGSPSVSAVVPNP